MKLADFIEGLNTLRPYFDGDGGYPLGAEHDVFYVYTTDRPLSPEDTEKMWALGWTQTEAEIVDGERVKVYDPESAWECYT